MPIHSTSTKISCHKCRQQVSGDVMIQIGQSVYCESCANQVEAARNRRIIMVVSAIGIAGVLAMVVGAWAWNYQNTQWDREHGSEILSLKTKAETAQSQGKTKEAGIAYEALLKVAEGHTAQTTELSSAISQARAAFDIIESHYRRILTKEADEKRAAEERIQKEREEKERLARAERERQENVAKVAQEAQEQERQKGTVHGDVWIALDDGSTIPIAGAKIMLLPSSVETKELYWESAVDQARIIFRNEPTIGRSTLQNIAAAQNAGKASTMDVGFWSWCVLLHHPSLKINAMMGRKNTDPRNVINTEPFWIFLASEAIWKASTDRNGNYHSPKVPSGSYVLLCRYYHPASGDFFIWQRPIYIKPQQDLAMTLNNQNASNPIKMGPF